MKYSLIIILFLLVSCASTLNSTKQKKLFASQGFAYIYDDKDYQNKMINTKFNNDELQISNNKLRIGSLIKISNLKTNDTIILKNSKKANYPDFYKILITKSVAKKINLTKKSPLVEIVEVKKNKSFVAKKTKIYKEEEKIHNNAPVETVKIDNISKNKKTVKKNISNRFNIIIAEFYSKDSAVLLKKRIIKELPNIDGKKLIIKSNNSNKSTLLSGPYNSINLMKNDYITLKNYGFEELEISIYE